MTQATDIIKELEALGNPAKAAHLSGFFRTAPGQYGEGDRFLGLTVPEQRQIARLRYREVSMATLGELMCSPWHEVRLTALLMLLFRFEKNSDTALQQECVDFYLAHTACINNWDLVDLTCYKLLGVWLEKRERRLLYDLARSSDLWEQRIAMVTCMHFVRKGDFTDCLAIADILLDHPHDLIHKAVGWLLCETGKKDRPTLTAFLLPRYTHMPRTMLRYAIEHFPEEERQAYLNGSVR